MCFSNPKSKKTAWDSVKFQSVEFSGFKFVMEEARWDNTNAPGAPPDNSGQLRFLRQQQEQLRAQLIDEKYKKLMLRQYAMQCQMETEVICEIYRGACNAASIDPEKFCPSLIYKKDGLTPDQLDRLRRFNFECLEKYGESISEYVAKQLPRFDEQTLEHVISQVKTEREERQRLIHADEPDPIDSERHQSSDRQHEDRKTPKPQGPVLVRDPPTDLNHSKEDQQPQPQGQNSTKPPLHTAGPKFGDNIRNSALEGDDSKNLSDVLMDSADFPTDKIVQIKPGAQRNTDTDTRTHGASDTRQQGHNGPQETKENRSLEESKQPISPPKVANPKLDDIKEASREETQGATRPHDNMKIDDSEFNSDIQKLSPIKPTNPGPSFEASEIAHDESSRRLNVNRQASFGASESQPKELSELDSKPEISAQSGVSKTSSDPATKIDNLLAQSVDSEYATVTSSDPSASTANKTVSPVKLEASPSRIEEASLKAEEATH